MNNSKIAIDSQDILGVKDFNKAPILRQKEGELVAIIEAVNRIADNSDWLILRKHIFDDLVGSLERRLATEAGKSELNQPEIHRLQGQLIWARKYSDFNKLADVFRSELKNVKQMLNTNPGTEPLIAPDSDGKSN
jgi:hypothetical protein